MKAGFKVYCLVGYDDRKNPEGAWTLVRMMRSDESETHPYDHRADNWNDIGNGPNMWKGNKNQAFRMARDKYRSVFKHSAGIIQTRYGNNRDGFHLTDVFGHPETGKHVLDQTCSDKSQFDIALGTQPPISHLISHAICSAASRPNLFPPHAAIALFYAFRTMQTMGICTSLVQQNLAR